MGASYRLTRALYRAKTGLNGSYMGNGPTGLALIANALGDGDKRIAAGEQKPLKPIARGKPKFPGNRGDQYARASRASSALRANTVGRTASASSERPSFPDVW
jgi:hypothetical protein